MMYMVNLEENLTQIHLPNWHFYLPNADMK